MKQKLYGITVKIQSKGKERKKESTFFCHCNDTIGCFLTACGITSMSYIMIIVTVTMCTTVRSVCAPAVGRNVTPKLTDERLMCSAATTDES